MRVAPGFAVADLRHQYARDHGHDRRVNDQVVDGTTRGDQALDHPSVDPSTVQPRRVQDRVKQRVGV